MPVDVTIPFSFTLKTLPEISSFNCDRAKEADMYNEEGSCCCYLTEHTYPFISFFGQQVCGIAGYGMLGPREATEDYYPAKLQGLVDGSWVDIATIYLNNKTPSRFEEYFNLNISGFRIKYGTSHVPFIDKTYGSIQFGDTPANQYTEQECQNKGCYWFNGSCHLHPPICMDLDNQPDCVAYGCYWALGKCHPVPANCWGWLTESDCVNAGCNWLTDKWGNEGCAEQGVKTAKLSLDPNEPADLYSSTPVDSQHAVFEFNKTIRVYRGKGTAMIHRGDTAGSTSIGFWVDTSELSKNRVRAKYKEMKSFDEYYRNGYKLEGKTFKVGTPFSGIKVGYCNMYLYYKEI